MAMMAKHIWIIKTSSQKNHKEMENTTEYLRCLYCYKRCYMYDSETISEGGMLERDKEINTQAVLYIDIYCTLLILQVLGLLKVLIMMLNFY